MKNRIREIVRDHAGTGLRLEDITDATDLYSAGMSSYASVALMIALENAFGIEFPDSLLNRDVFENVDAIARAIECTLQLSHESPTGTR
jgi:acyl carrier protein